MGTANGENFQSVLDLIWHRRYDPTPVIHFYKQFKCYDSWSYSQLWMASQRIAQSLSHLPPQTAVFISLPNGPEFLASFFACLMNGLWPAPVVSPEVWSKPEYLDSIRRISERTEIRHIITTSSLAHELKAQGQKVHVFTDLWKQAQSVKSCERPARTFASSDVALIQFSSGSTAESKGVMLSHERILRNLSQILQGMDAQPEEKMSTWLPLYHDMGLIGGFLAPLLHQAQIHLSSPVDFVMDPLGWLAHVSDVGATVMVGPDFMYKLLARKAAQRSFRKDLSKLRVCMTGAEPVLAATCRDFVRSFSSCNLSPVSLMPVYGMAEAVLGVSFSKPCNQVRTQRVPSSNSEWVSCGRPLDQVRIEIRSEAGQCLPERSVGEIFISSPSLTVGFYKRPDLNALYLHDGWLRTGDLGFVSEGELYITGRTKDVVIIRGRKIHAIDLETKIYEKWKEHISRVALVTRSESADNQALIVAVEVRSWFKKNLRSEDVAKFLKSQSPELDFEIFLLPKKSLPRTSSGKLKRYQIREMVANGQLNSLSKTSRFHALERRMEQFGVLWQMGWAQWAKKSTLDLESTDPLRTEIESAFCKVTQKAAPISFETTFQDWGLDSIQMMELLMEMETRFGQVPLEKFYQFKNLADVHVFLTEEHSRKKSANPSVSQTSL